MPAYRVKLRRGTSAEHANFVGAEGEVTVDTDKKRLVVHDGVTPGGFLIAALEDVKTDISEYTDSEGLMGGYTYDVQGTTLPLTSTSPIVNYTVTVASGFRYNGRGIPGGPGDVFYLRNDTAGETEFTENPHITLQTGYTYVFDMSDASNSGHPLQFTTDMGQTAFTSGVTTLGTAGQAGATVTFTVPSPRPLNLMYYCGVHGAGMGGEITIGSDAYVAPTVATPAPAWYGDRGVIASGNGLRSMEYIDITSTGSAQAFGDLLTKSNGGTATSDGTYGYIGGGDTDVGAWPESDYSDRIEQVTISTSGTTSSFGNLTIKRQLLSSVDDTSTYGVYSGGWGGPGTTISRQSVLDYITMGTSGTATTFGNLTQARSHQAGVNDDTYGLFAGGTNAGTVDVSGIDYITIASAGAASSFGNLSANKYGAAGVKDGTYGVIGGGYTGTQSITIEYVTIGTSGTAETFGNLTVKSQNLGATSNSTRGVFVGGSSGDGVRNDIMDYVTIATAGSATSFGNLISGRDNTPACMSGNAA